MIFGLKGVDHQLIFMPNDDVDTPTVLVGKKIAPILKVPGESTAMPESLDIVKRIDEGPEYGPPILKPATGRSDLKAWSSKVSGVMRLLVRPRYPKGFFPEFAFGKAREAFVKNHPMPDPDTGVTPSKEEWKSMAPETWHSWYASHLENTPSLLKELNSAMTELEDMIHSEESVSPEGLGYDDIIFWDRLRGATLVKGLSLGPKAKAYVKKMSEKTDIPLLSGMAI